MTQQIMTGPKFAPAVPSAQLSAARKAYSKHGHVRITAPYPPKTAQAIYSHLANDVEWWRTLNQGEKLWDLGPESIAELEGPKGDALRDAIHLGAQNGFQFFYDNCRCSENPAERAARGLMLDHVLDGLNSPAAIAMFQKLTGDETINLVDGQATRYLPGHFLTAHDDGVAGKNRRAAYVINLTPEWKTDWGGLLQFHDEFGDVTHALRPCFNAIHIFKVPTLHSVSMVTPFAKGPRYSITGWLRRSG